LEEGTLEVHAEDDVVLLDWNTKSGVFEVALTQADAVALGALLARAAGCQVDLGGGRPPRR
jgi:hypothetical protein